MEKTTEWVLGQPLVFPTKLNTNEPNRVRREAIDPAIDESLTNPTTVESASMILFNSPIASLFLSQ